MERLKTQSRYLTFKLKGDEVDKKKLPKTLEELPRYLRRLVIWIEGFYSDISNRVNWLMTNTVEAHTSDDTLTEYETGSVHSNLGATGAVTLTLPTVTKAGIKFIFAVQVAQELRIDPGAATIRDDSGQTADKYKTANAIGEALQLISDSNGDWVTIGKTGTWTEEA